MKELERLYAIADRATLDARGMSVGEFARELARAGVGVLQYRDKVGAPNEVLRAAKEIAAEFAGSDCVLILNDRPDLALLAGWGVHVGHLDMSPVDVRKVVGAGRVIGVSTHNEAQIDGGRRGRGGLCCDRAGVCDGDARRIQSRWWGLRACGGHGR